MIPIPAKGTAFTTLVARSHTHDSKLFPMFIDMSFCGLPTTTSHVQMVVGAGGRGYAIDGFFSSGPALPLVSACGDWQTRHLFDSRDTPVFCFTFSLVQLAI